MTEKKSVGDASEELPFVSVIVPVYNDERRIGECIKSLLDQTYPRDRYEIFIVDNGSTDGTRKVVQKYPVTLLVEDEILSSYAARNKGIQNAKGEILAFTDSDVKVSNSWLQNGIKSMSESGADYVGSRVELYNPRDNVTYWDLHSMIGVFPVKENIEQSNFTPTCNLFVGKSVIRKIGMFDPRLVSAGDFEFGQRVKDAGFKQAYAENAVIYHPTRSTFQEYVKWAFRIGRGKAQLARYYPKRYKKAISGFQNPKKYLPPAPWKFSGKIKGYKTMSLSHKSRIYLVTYIKNVCLPLGVLAGILAELISRKRHAS